jgi:hypothetical protein
VETKPKTMIKQIQFPLYESPKRDDNEEKYGHILANQCICCMKPMADNETYMVHMSTEWLAMDNSIVTTTDAEKHGLESQGYFPVGNTCAKKMPRNYLHKK